MNKRSFFQTKIKRSHLVLQYGVGALIRSRQGVTALVAGLPEWDHFLMVRSGQDHEVHDHYLRKHRFKEPELEAATGVHYFVPPPSEVQGVRAWELPLIRFPLTGVCTNWQCQRVTIGSHGVHAGRKWQCGHCSGKRGSTINQVAIFHACPLGHVDEIDFAAAIEHTPGCPSAIATVKWGSRLESPTIRCATCQGTGSLAEIACTGARPWLPTVGPDACDETMEIVSRTSVKTYYGNTKSAIHIPLEENLNDELLRWIDNNGMFKLIPFDSENDRRKGGQAIIDAGWNVSVEHAILHIEHHRLAESGDEESWNVLEARVREFDVLSGRRKYSSLEISPLISMSRRPISDYSNEAVASGLITNVTAVHKLTETRVLNGFARIAPRTVTPRQGRLLMWGRDTGEFDWLPGYRSHGEGIFIEFDSQRLGPQGATEAEDGSSLFSLSPAGITVHTFAHLMVLALAESAGYSVPSIRDRVFDLAGGRLGVLVYTAEGDSMGTLGGLVAHAEPQEFDELISRILDHANWCAQDPVCSETVHSADRHIGAACHQCVLLPETSCELFNSFIDRRLVIKQIVGAT